MRTRNTLLSRSLDTYFYCMCFNVPSEQSGRTAYRRLWSPAGVMSLDTTADLPQDADYKSLRMVLTAIWSFVVSARVTKTNLLEVAFPQ
jgi:hypothetical protein